MGGKPDFRADLHCHSTCSDGSLSPEQLVAHAYEIGLKGLSITDHDTVDAYPNAEEVGKQLGVRVLPGVEFSAQLQGRGVHVLGYAFEANHQSLQTLVHRHQGRRQARNAAILTKLQKRGMMIYEEDLPGPLNKLGRPHIAAALVKKGYVTSIQGAFKRWIGEGTSCFERGEGISVVDTVQAIREAGGIAILAHPHLIKDRSLQRQLLAMSFDGLEGYYAYFPKEVDEQWCRRAEERGWLITGGSDFHGDPKPQNRLGRSWVGEEVFEELWKHYQKVTKIP